jgi:hypothetical protein
MGEAITYRKKERTTVAKDKIEERKLRRNGSGYSDPTAYAAIKKADLADERFHMLLGAIYNICELSGFELEERIVLRDKRTGKVWR